MSPQQSVPAGGQTQSQAEQISYEEWTANREEERAQAQQLAGGNAAAMPALPQLRTSAYMANYMSPQQQSVE